MFVEIQNTNLNKTIIGIVYRPPDNIRLDDFHEHIQHIPNIMTSENKTCYFIGNFSINLLSSYDSANNFLNIMSSFFSTPNFKPN